MSRSQLPEISMTMSPPVRAAYEHLLGHAVEHNTETSHELGSVLLNSYNWNLPGTGFRVGRFRCLDRENQNALLIYLQWLGSSNGLYPPSGDMEALKKVWAERGWLPPHY